MTILSRLLDQLRTDPPRTGRIIAEDGTVVNEASLMTGGGIKSKMLAASGNPIADNAHSRIHQGVLYHCGHLAASVADGASIDIGLTTPQDVALHLLTDIDIDGSADILISEGVTFTGGTAISVINQNRNSTNLSGVVAVHTPGGIVLGTQIRNCHISGATASGGGGGGAGGLAGGAASGFDFELILLPSTKYLFRLTNRSGAASRASLCPFFYTVAYS